MQTAEPGFKPDLLTLNGWISGQLFAQALRAAGPNPNRGSVLKALRSTKTFSAGNLIAGVNPTGKVPASCYIIGQVTNGNFTRVDDPPINGSSGRYRCDHRD